jgi:hypothetical protein
MRRPAPAVLVHGMVGGFLAGLVVVVWFLVVDTIAGYPFLTPRLLAGMLLNQDFAQVTPGLVAAYTVLHFAVFALFGVGMALVSAVLKAPSRLLLGVLFGLLLQEIVFYAGLLVLHAPHLGVIPWPHVIGANIAAGLVLMTYLHRAEHDPRPLGIPALHLPAVVSRGVVTGVIGAVVVAVWFFFVDIISGTPLRTPAALASALLIGASSPGGIVVTFGLVAAYSVVHVVAFAIAGVVFVALAEQLERAPAMGLLVLLAAIVLDSLVLATISVGAQWVLGSIGWWSVVVANLLAVIAMGWQVWRTHPVLQRRLLKEHAEVRV